MFNKGVHLVVKRILVLSKTHGTTIKMIDALFSINSVQLKDDLSEQKQLAMTVLQL